MDAPLRIARNLVDTMTAFANAWPGAVIRDSPCLRLIDLGSELQIFNTVVMKGAPADDVALHEELDGVRKHFRSRGLRWSMWLCEDFLPPSLVRAMPEVIAACDLEFNSRMPGMIAPALVEAGPPGELSIRPVESAQDRWSFCRILTLSFNGPADQLSAMYGREGLWKDGFRGYLGSVNGDDVCAGVAVASEASLGIYALATLPAYKRRGYASAIVRHAADDSRSRNEEMPLVLQSAERAPRLYRRLGFRQVSEFSLYTSRE